MTVEGSTILIIEDDQDAADTIETVCHKLGHPTLVAYDGMTGLSMAASMRPRLILSDIAMPGLDGFEVARRVRSNHDLDGTAIVAVTGYPPKTAAANQKAFDGYVMKPFSFETLQTVIDKFLH